MKTVLVLTSISLLSTGLLAGNWFVVQDAELLPPVLAQPYAVQDYEAAHERHNISVAGFYRNESQAAVSAAVEALKSAEDDAAKRAAENDLKKALDADYDARLEGYEKHLDQLEAELAKMRDQLQKRKMAKSEMVDLRLQVLTAEADDLGWPSPVGPSGGYRYFQSTNPFGGVWSGGFGPATAPSAPAGSSQPVAPVAPRTAVPPDGGR